MMKRYWLFTFFLLMVGVSVFAQKHPCMVSGSVVAANDIVLPYASVYISQHDTVVMGTLTNQKGQFELVVSRSQESYLLTVVFVGYKTKQLEVMADKDELSLGKILMEATSQSLDEVSISANEGEKTVVTASHTSITSVSPTDWMGGTVADLLRQQSSVTVDPNGVVSLRGNSNVLLLLDGVPTNIGSINAIPSSNVASIDIITNPRRLIMSICSISSRCRSGL